MGWSKHNLVSNDRTVARLRLFAPGASKLTMHVLSTNPDNPSPDSRESNDVSCRAKSNPILKSPGTIKLAAMNLLHGHVRVKTAVCDRDEEQGYFGPVPALPVTERRGTSLLRTCYSVYLIRGAVTKRNSSFRLSGTGCECDVRGAVTKEQVSLARSVWPSPNRRVFAIELVTPWYRKFSTKVECENDFEMFFLNKNGGWGRVDLTAGRHFIDRLSGNTDVLDTLLTPDRVHTQLSGFVNNSGVECCQGARRTRSVVWLYDDRFSKRRHPSVYVFLRLEQRCRETGEMRPGLPVDAGRPRNVRIVPPVLRDEEYRTHSIRQQLSIRSRLVCIVGPSFFQWHQQQHAVDPDFIGHFLKILVVDVFLESLVE
uniref:Uncharacterized protein n=1 Tax=Timema tahoe TaxID=61484 RepID=A0A7R9NWS4_9NEOP|nr:unnamed protein product [Timema tahoe]